MRCKQAAELIGEEQSGEKRKEEKSALDGLRLGQALCEVGARGPRAEEALGLEGHHRPREEAQRARVLREVAQHVGRVEELDLHAEHEYRRTERSNEYESTQLQAAASSFTSLVWRLNSLRMRMRSTSR